MLYSEILQSTLEYIDEHVKDELNADLLASKAGFRPTISAVFFDFMLGTR